MRYDDQIVDRVQSANDIVEIISQYLTLKRSGRNFKACCPFHNEKSPSFMVQPEKQIFHCFGCGVGGDVFSFLMKHENMNFPEALRFLAERASITLPEPVGKKAEGASDNEQLYDLYKIAADFYHEQFKDPVKGKAAREYFLKRGFPMELAEELKVGWAPEGWRNLLEAMVKKGFKDTLLLKSALVMRSPKGNLYDTFRSRILFPILNLQGKIIAFGGRILADAEGPKYLNSPEHPIFQKRRELFGLYLAKKHINRDRPQMLVVEGYFDFLRLYQYGFKAAVATLGTALTDDHVQVLKRFAEEAVVVYDGDKAGEAAALRGLEVFLEGGMNVKIARVPSGFDPDDFVQKEGAAAFQKVLDEARDFFDYKLEILTARFNRSDSLGLMKISGEFMETLSKIQSSVLTDRYLRRLAGALGVDENSLRTELIKAKKKTGKAEPAQSISKPTPATPATAPYAEDELMLCVLALEEKDLRRKFLTECTEADFAQGDLKELYHWVISPEAEGQSQSWARVLSRVSNAQLRTKLTSLSALEWDRETKVKAFGDCLARLKARKIENRLDELRRGIAKAERDGNLALVGNYMKEYQILWKESKGQGVS